MMADARASGIYENGAADYMEPPSLDETVPTQVDSSFDNAWPGTGDGILGWEDLASSNDENNGQWDVTPSDGEAADNAAVSDLRVIKGRQQLLAQIECESCLGGNDCIAGCKVFDSPKMMAKHAAHDVDEAPSQPMIPSPVPDQSQGRHSGQAAVGAAGTSAVHRRLVHLTCSPLPSLLPRPCFSVFPFPPQVLETSCFSLQASPEILLLFLPPRPPIDSHSPLVGPWRPSAKPQLASAHGTYALTMYLDQVAGRCWRGGMAEDSHGCASLP